MTLTNGDITYGFISDRQKTTPCLAPLRTSFQNCSDMRIVYKVPLKLIVQLIHVVTQELNNFLSLHTAAKVPCQKQTMRIQQGHLDAR